ncbi:MAG: ribosome-associated translation inhibitor RaiA [Acidobacteria bacterium]|nr:ribosome-associated translation inhibitor RaiA [Acidobacteriaceae bacterium]MBV9610018.1 ribosome-associated translation inhibitor RaiA [Acidobacteriota bacterium]
MKVEYTGRQYEVTPPIRKQIDKGLAKIEKILGTTFSTNVVLAAEKHRHIAEITVTVRTHPIVGIAESTEMSSAIIEALERIERQALKYKGRWRDKKRQPKQKWNGEATAAEQRAAVGMSLSTAVPVVVHTFPGVVRTTEAHVLQSTDSVSHTPLTLEEAIKEAEFRDREVFVFRDANGRVRVLHRRKDGKMELIDAP